MKMKGQSRSFVKQVQVDLLALSDADLFLLVCQWIDGDNIPGLSADVPEDTRLALGYTYILSEDKPSSDHHSDVPDVENEVSTQWQVPTPHYLRILLTEMDANLFSQHIIAFAFKALHTTYPEWYDGATFNAHLANYLRQMRIETASHEHMESRSI